MECEYIQSCVQTVNFHPESDVPIFFFATRWSSDAARWSNKLLVILTETRVSNVAAGTNTTSGMRFNNLSWGTDSPVFLTAIAAGGVASPMKSNVLSALFGCIYFFRNSTTTVFFLSSSTAFSLSSKHSYICHTCISNQFMGDVHLLIYI